MFEQFNNQVIQFSKQMSETMIKANTLVVDQFEKMAEVQLKGFEMRANAAAEMVEVASSVKSPEDFRTFLPKTVAFFKESAEKNMAFAQEVAMLSAKSVEQFVALGKQNFEAANDQVIKTSKVASKK
jgi:hypothetical protein